MKVGTTIKTICSVGSLALLASAFVGLSPAGASGGGLQQASAASVIDSSQYKSVTVNCPPDTYVTGTGAQINVAKPGKVGLVSVTPLPGLTAVTVVAAETGKGTPLNWNVKAFAMCVPPLFPIYLGYATSLVNSINKSVTASCPSGWVLSGAGGQVSTPDTGKVFLHGVDPTSTSVTAEAAENGAGTPNNWYLKAYVICVQPSAVPGIQYAAQSTVGDSTHAKAATVFCPAGKRVIGVASDLLTEDSLHVIIEDMNPLPDLSGVTAVASEGGGKSPANWYVTAYALCAPI